MHAIAVHDSLHELTHPTSQRRSVEVLAPAGDASALDAALAAGADAVYFGVNGFNARARAQNFAVESLGEVMARLHAAGASGYVTVNTLVFDHERQAVSDVLRACADAEVDAVIVQDLGVALWAREVAPDLPLHASTQMTCTDSSALGLAQSLGISRVVLPRELTLDEIGRIRAESSLELEVFVHGALCVSFSGQCLASLAMGGRSANRGMCAQPCRLPYTVLADGRAQRHGYVLSPSDLDASEWIPRLLDAGVCALKIEGRLKGAAYVGATVRLVREVARAWERGKPSVPDPLVREASLQMFSRGSGPGFLGGVDHQRLVDPRTSDHRGLLLGKVESVQRIGGKPHVVLRTQASLSCGDGILIEASDEQEELGGRVWAVRAAGRPADSADAGAEVALWLGPDKVPSETLRGRRLFRTSAPRFESMVAKWIGQGREREGLRVSVRGSMGAPAQFLATTVRGRSAQVLSSVPIATAERRPLTRETIAEKLGRLGESRYDLQELQIELPVDAMLPLSSLNDARRRLVEQLDSSWVPRRAPGSSAGIGLAALTLPEPPPTQALVLCRREHHIEAALEAGARCLILDLPDARAIRRACASLRMRREDRAFLIVPTLRVRKPGESALDHALLDLEPDGVLVRSLASLADLANGKTRRLGIADASLNVANSTTARAVLGAGARAFTPSWDLAAAAPASWFERDLMPFVEFVAYGRRPMFHTQHCLYGANLTAAQDCPACDRPCEHVSLCLRDRTGKDHPVHVDRAGRNTVFEAGRGDRFDAARKLRAQGVRRFRAELLDETPAEVREIVRMLVKTSQL